MKLLIVDIGRYGDTRSRVFYGFRKVFSSTTIDTETAAERTANFLKTNKLYFVAKRSITYQNYCVYLLTKGKRK
jgi:hypothetical protein